MSYLVNIHEFAIPSRGSYKDHIGSIQYVTPDGEVYETLIMTKTDPNFTINGRKYPIIKGYIQVKPFLDKYLENNKDNNKKIEVRDVCFWKRDTKTY